MMSQAILKINCKSQLPTLVFNKLQKFLDYNNIQVILMFIVLLPTIIQLIYKIFAAQHFFYILFIDEYVLIAYIYIHFIVNLKPNNVM